MRRSEWLIRETEYWARDGVITPEQRRAILRRYSSTLDEHITAQALVWLAWLVAGFGLVLLVSWNWSAIPASLKVGGAGLVTVGLYGRSGLVWRKGVPRRAEALAFAGALSTGALIAAIAETLALSPGNTMPMLIWAVAIAVTALAWASPLTTALGAGVLFFWALTDTGRPPAPWAFLLVFPLLAVAVERRVNAYAAGAVTLAFGGCVLLVGLDTWRASAVPGVMLMAAGAAVDSWAHWPPDQRPAFARVTPALAMVVAGLVIQGIAALQGGRAPQLFGEPNVVWPGLVLLASLTLVAIWPSPGQRDATWRPLAIGSVVPIFVASAWLAGARTPAPYWWSWEWIGLSSVALVMVTVSAVRESVLTRQRGVLVIGVAAMAALVLMHFTGQNHRFGRSALVLFAAAAVLWWVSRTTRYPPRITVP